MAEKVALVPVIDAGGDAIGVAVFVFEEVEIAGLGELVEHESRAVGGLARPAVRDICDEDIKIAVVVDVVYGAVEGVAICAEGWFVGSIEAFVGFGAFLEPVGIFAVSDVIAVEMDLRRDVLPRVLCGIDVLGVEFPDAVPAPAVVEFDELRKGVLGGTEVCDH